MGPKRVSSERKRSTFKLGPQTGPTLLFFFLIDFVNHFQCFIKRSCRDSTCEQPEMSSQLNQIDLERKLERIDEKLSIVHHAPCRHSNRIDSISVDQIDQITSIQNELNQLTIDCMEQSLPRPSQATILPYQSNSWTCSPRSPQKQRKCYETHGLSSRKYVVQILRQAPSLKRTRCYRRSRRSTTKTTRSTLSYLAPKSPIYLPFLQQQTFCTSWAPRVIPSISAVQQSPDSSDKKAPRQQTRRSTRSSQAEVTRPLQVLEQEKRGVCDHLKAPSVQGDKYVSRLSKKLTKECQKTHEARFINALTDKKSFSKVCVFRAPWMGRRSSNSLTRLSQ